MTIIVVFLLLVSHTKIMNIIKLRGRGVTCHPIHPPGSAPVVPPPMNVSSFHRVGIEGWNRGVE